MHLITMEKDVMNLKINGEEYVGRSGRRKRKGILEVNHNLKNKRKIGEKMV